MGVSGLQLVAVERLLSIEGTAEILMDVTFLRGPCRGAPQRLPFQGPIPPIRGKCPEGTKGVGMLSAKQTGRSLQICIEKIQTANSVCGLERKK